LEIISAAISAILLGTDGMQAAIIVIALPLGIVLLFMFYALIKSFRQAVTEDKKQNKKTDKGWRTYWNLISRINIHEYIIFPLSIPLFLFT